MFTNDVNPDKYLYHYTSHVTALEHILPSSTIRLSPYKNTNDPRESKDWNFNLICPKNLPKGNELFEIKEDMNLFLKGRTKVLCLTKDVMEVDINREIMYTERGYAHPRMWAQYGGNHKGICLIFDKEKLKDIILETLLEKGKLFRGSVTYGRTAPNNYFAFELNFDEIKTRGLKSVASDHLSKFYKELFFEKPKDWKDECEYRWVFLSNSTNDYEYINFKEALVAIVLGVDFPPVYETIIESYCKKYRLPAARMYWYNGSAQVHPVYVPENGDSFIKKVF